MENDNDEMVEIPEIPQVNEGQEDTTDWKAEALKYQGIAKRYDTKLKKLGEVKPEAKPEVKVEQPQVKSEFDLAEKTYILANGLKKDQIPMVLEEIKKSGKPVNETSINEILESPYFKEKLEQEASKEALPLNSKRGGGAARDSVDYWIARGELPPNSPENTELRRKVAKARTTQEVDGRKFSDKPIIG